MKMAITHWHIGQIRNMAADGKTPEYIARRIHLPTTQVRDLAEKHKIEFNIPRTAKERYMACQLVSDEKIKALYAGQKYKNHVGTEITTDMPSRMLHGSCGSSSQMCLEAHS